MTELTVQSVLRPIGACVLALLLCVSTGVQAESESVNINTADAATLAIELDGVGEAKARAIVNYRETYGDFASAEELAAVRGIGERVLEANLDKIRVTD